MVASTVASTVASSDVTLLACLRLLWKVRYVACRGGGGIGFLAPVYDADPPQTVLLRLADPPKKAAY